MINSKGKELPHEWLKQIMESLQLSKRIAVTHVNVHQKGSSFEIIGNRIANEKAKKASDVESMKVLISTVEQVEDIPVFSDKEEKELIQLGG